VRRAGGINLLFLDEWDFTAVWRYWQDNRPAWNVLDSEIRLIDGS